MRRPALLVILLALAALAAGATENRPGPARRLLIIDDDIGMLKDEVRKAGSYVAPWIPVTDPDGGLELLYALRDPAVEVLAVTCSMGCSTTDVCMASAREILRLAGREDVPVLRGAESPDDLGRPTDAALHIIHAVMNNPGQVEIVATAPLTNLATAIMLEPCLPMNWKALHVGTGEFMGELGHKSDAYRARYTGYRDLNINVDPAAARYIVERGGDFHLYPNEIMDDAWFTLADVREIRNAGTTLGDFVGREISPFFHLIRAYNALSGHPGMYLHGVIPLAIALDPALAKPPTMLRVQMIERKHGGHGFTVTDDPAVPLRPVYLELADPDAVKARAAERSQ